MDRVNHSAVSSEHHHGLGPLVGRFFVSVLVSHHVVKERLDERLSRARHGVLHLFEAPNSVIAVNDALP